MKPRSSNCQQFTAVDKTRAMIFPLAPGRVVFFPPRIRFHGQRAAILKTFRQVTTGTFLDQHAHQTISYAGQDNSRSHPGWKFKPHSFFPSFETAVQEQQSVPFWHKPAWLPLKNGLIRSD
jgi:hypothetical protein